MKLSDLSTSSGAGVGNVSRIYTVKRRGENIRVNHILHLCHAPPVRKIRQLGELKMRTFTSTSNYETAPTERAEAQSIIF